MRKIWPGLILLLSLNACDRIDAWLHPYDETAPLQAIPAPPQGQADAYPEATGIRLQSRTGDCVKTSCFTFDKGRWRPLTDADKSLPILGIDPATGSAYGDDLWRPIGNGRAVLINSQAAEQNIGAGVFDGMRIGLRDKGQTVYVTAFATDNGTATLPDAKIIAVNGRAWLLQTHDNRSSNLVDLFAITTQPTMTCLPGLALETRPWAGPAEKALSPDIFVSRAVDSAAAKAEHDATRACLTAKKPTGTP